jgi:C2 domain
MDAASKSDPMCVVWIESRDQNGWTEHGRTEVIKDSLNPEFSTQICIEYHLEELQKMKFAIYDVDHPTGPLNSQDFLGEASCTLGQIVSAGRLELQLAPHGGWIIIESHDVSNKKEILNLCFSGQQLGNPRFLSEPNPVLALYRLSPEGQKTLIHRSARIKHTRRPNWPKFSVPLCLLEKDGAETKILIECLDHRKRGNHKLIGQVQLNCCDLYQSPKTFELTKPVIYIPH